MDQATVSSWKLLPWLMMGGSNKKTQVARSSIKVSAYKRRLQAHAAIARSLSPFCARTSLNSPAMPAEENKICLLSLSAFMSVCGHCALRDVQVALAPNHSPHQQKAYIKAIHHHLQEPSFQHHTKPPSSRRTHHKAAFGGVSHTEKANTSREGYSMQRRDHHHHPRHMTPPKKGGVKRLEAFECNQIVIKPSKQEQSQQLKHDIEGEVIRSGESKPEKYGRLRHELEVYSFDSTNSDLVWRSHCAWPTTSSSSSKQGIHRPKVPSLDGRVNDPIQCASHSCKASSAKSKKTVSQHEPHHGKSSSVTKQAAYSSPSLEAELYVCTTAHVLKQHKGKMKSFEEMGMHDDSCKHPSWKDMHLYKDGDPRSQPAIHHNHAASEPPPKSKHWSVSKGLETSWQVSEDSRFLKESKSLKARADDEHTNKDPSLSYLSVKAYQKSKARCAGKDPLSVKCTQSFTNKDPSSMSFKSNDSTNMEPLALKGSEFCVNKDPLSLKSSESYARKNLSSKLTLSPVYRDTQGDDNAAKARHKVRIMRLGHHDKVSDGIWMQDTLPVVKYSQNPYKDFHSSMLEMLLERGVKDLHELQDMFVCYVLLNSPCNQTYIEAAFRDLITDLYKCKLMKSLQVEQMQLAKTEGLRSH